MFLCMYIHTDIQTYRHAYIYIYTFIYIYIYTHYIHSYIYIYVYINIHIMISNSITRRCSPFPSHPNAQDAQDGLASWNRFRSDRKARSHEGERIALKPGVNIYVYIYMVLRFFLSNMLF